VGIRTAGSGRKAKSFLTVVWGTPLPLRLAPVGALALTNWRFQARWVLPSLQALAQPAFSGRVLLAHGILAGWIREAKYWSCFAVRSAVRVIRLRSSAFPCEPPAASNAKFAEKCCIPGLATMTTPGGRLSKGDRRHSGRERSNVSSG
jgi:hypothetical protein